MKKVKCLFFLALLGFYSCTEDSTLLDTESCTGETVLKSGGDGKYDLLGYGLDISAPYLDYSNCHLPVIDVQKLISERPFEYQEPLPKTSIAYITAGSNALEWSAKLHTKFSSSFSFKSIFTASMKKDITATQKVSSRHSYATCFYNIYQKHMKIFTKKEILRNYLTYSFKNALKTLSCDEIIQRYGTHVYTDIFTGGKLEVDYRSVAKTNDKELAVNAGVSYTMAKVFGINAEGSVNTSYKTSNSSVTCSFRSIGGNPGSCIFGTIDEENINKKINIGTWSSTVKPDNSVLVDVGDKSLIPIYELVPDRRKAEELKSAVIRYLERHEVSLAFGSIFCSYDLCSTRDRAISLDFNGDGYEDVMFYRPGARLVYLNSSLGDGTFEPCVTSSNGLAGYRFSSGADRAVAFDYNGDGYDDLFCYHPGHRIVQILKSKGNGSFSRIFQSTKGIAGYRFSSGADRAVAFDYNGDGKDDLFCYNPGKGIVQILKSNGNGSFTRIFQSTRGIAGYRFCSGADRAVAFDYNGDGYDDLFCYHPGKRIVQILKSNGNGSFTRIFQSTNGIAGYLFSSGADRAVSLDYNGDGYDDLFCYHPGHRIVHLLKSKGNGRFLASMVSTSGILGYDFADGDDRILPLDYNHDGLCDILINRPGSRKAITARSTKSFFSLDYPY